MSSIEVSSLHYYPIKSCGGIETDAAEVGTNGLRYDREWMLVGKRGQFLSQRRHPNLALVETDIRDGQLIVTAPKLGELAISLRRPKGREEVAVNLWKKPGSGIVESDEVNGYFSEYLGTDARLLRIQQARTIKPECQVDGATTQTAFADGFPMLLTSEESLGSLNAQLERDGEEAVSMDRFRPNIVVKGAEAYGEDYWRDLRIGGLRAFVVRACARCPIPNIDQSKGVLRRERPVTDALRRTRSGVDPINNSTGEFFGQNLVHEFKLGAVLRVGDQVNVVEMADEPNWLAA